MDDDEGCLSALRLQNAYLDISVCRMPRNMGEMQRPSVRKRI